MIFVLARKELKSLFSTPMGWVILAVLGWLFGNYYSHGVNNYFEVMSGAIRPAERVGVTQFVAHEVYGWASFIMLVTVPLLSMRLLSEERRNQTLPFLLSAPITLTEIVLGKFLSLVVFLGILVLYIALMLCTLNLWADIDFGYILANSLGLMLLVASFSALGIYVSSLTQQPVVAAILSFIALFALVMLDRLFSQNLAWADLSLMHHFQPFSNGLIDTGDLAYFVLFIVGFLILTIRRLDADRLLA